MTSGPQTWVRGLINAGQFGHSTTQIELIETHISWVLLTGQFAYKIKKPLNLGFLDFSTLELRHKYCLLELDLNRRFAPNIYLDVVSIGGDPERPVVGCTPALEWAVRMRQFPNEARLDRKIKNRSISTNDLGLFGEFLAQLHAQSSVAQPNSNHGSVSSIGDTVEDNFSTLGAHCESGDSLIDLADWSKQELERLAPLLQGRQTDGYIRECHGDLHLENLVVLDNRITPFDCIEFDAGLRNIDVLNEVAFLFMDLLRVTRPDLGYSFLNRYLEVSGDYPGVALLRFYCVYRCLVRAKIAALSDANASLVRYIELARQIARLAPEPAMQRPCLIICRGLSGSGKTVLSSKLLLTLPAIRVRSDIVRKQLHDLAELDSTDSPVGAGLYDPQSTLRTYEALRQYSGVLLTAGHHVIVDATFLRRSDRRLLQSVAENTGASFAILDCVAADRLLAERITARHSMRHDASEADLQVLEWQQAHLDPLTTDELRHALRVDTGEKYCANKIARQLQEMSGRT